MHGDALPTPRGSADEVIEDLRRQLARQDLRIQELQHRALSGSLAVARQLGALLSELRDPAARAVLEEARSRVEALGDIHRTLAPRPAAEYVDMRASLGDLCAALSRALDANGRDITLRLTVTGPALPARIAIPICLIANELVGNALRFAFRGRSRGTVSVVLRTAGDRVMFSVSDDGVGISERTLRRDDTGLWLVRQLASELSAILDLNRDDGTSISVLIPLSEGA